MRNLLLTIILLASAFISQAQNSLTNSLLVALSKAKTDSVKVLVLCDLSRQYSLSDPNKALEFAQKGKALATKIDYAIGKAKALNLMGGAHVVLGEYDKAMALHYQALEIGEKNKDTTILIQSNINLGIDYFKTNDQERSIKYNNQAAALASQINDSLALSKIYNNLGNVYEVQKQYKKALNFFFKAAALQEKFGNKRSLGVSLLNIGNVYQSLNQPQKGMPYLFKSSRINQEIQNNLIQIVALRVIGEGYLQMGKPDKALEFGTQSLEMALETKSSKKIMESAELMHKIYAAKKDYKQAYAYLTLFSKHEALLDIQDQKNITANITTLHESAKKELAFQKLKVEKEKQALHLKYQKSTLIFGTVLVCLMLVLVLVLYTNWRRIKTANKLLKVANQRMQVQNNEISKQKDALTSQSGLLQSKNAELARHNTFKNKIFSIISHDLRTPFNSTKGILKLVEENRLSEAEMKHIYGLLSKEMDVATGMLNNLLVWAKSQLAESSVTLEPLDLQQLANDTLHLVSLQAKEKAVNLVNLVQEPVIILSDRERLNFVLRNLLLNAIKFSYAHGDVKVGLKQKEDLTIIQVTDTGKGISARHLTKLFTDERFTTLGTSKEKGTGLGLMLCKELLESLHGEITVESEEGKGSTFSISIPTGAYQPQNQVSELPISSRS